MSSNTGIAGIAKGLEGLQLSVDQTTRKAANTVRGVLPFTGVTAAQAAPATTAATAATAAAESSSIDPYDFDCILQFPLGANKENLKNLKKISLKQPIQSPSRIVETAYHILQIPHSVAHDWSHSHTRYYINKSAYYDIILKDPYLIPSRLSEFWILPFQHGEETVAKKLGDKLRPSKSGGQRKYTKRNIHKKKSTRKHK